jgi:hypothetical protein
MGVFIDLAGCRFGRLIALRRAANKGRATMWECRCDCGGHVIVWAGALRKGESKSCGCLARDVSRENGRARLRHGYSRTPTHRSWLSMLARCECVTHHAYARYGGRGIKVCDSWHVFEHFLADMGERPAGLTLDRRDNNGGYDAANCYWATRQEQSNNKRDNLKVLIDGREQTVTQWAREMGLSVLTVRGRISRGWSLRRALTAPRQSFSERPQSLRRR